MILDTIEIFKYKYKFTINIIINIIKFSFMKLFKRLEIIIELDIYLH